MGKKAWCAFVACQVIGEICQWSWPVTRSAIGPVFWYGAFLLLLPGNFASAFLIERFFWMRGLTLLQMQLIEVPVEIGINLGVWALGAWVWQHLSVRSRRSAGSPVVH